jgi:hypothetical protein
VQRRLELAQRAQQPQQPLGSRSMTVSATACALPPSQHIEEPAYMLALKEQRGHAAALARALWLRLRRKAVAARGQPP